jgi:hypothetical protein
MLSEVAFFRHPERMLLLSVILSEGCRSRRISIEHRDDSIGAIDLTQVRFGKCCHSEQQRKISDRNTDGIFRLRQPSLKMTEMRTLKICLLSLAQD